MAVEIISWSFSTKVLDWTRFKLATPGSAVSGPGSSVSVAISLVARSTQIISNVQYSVLVENLLVSPNIQTYFRERSGSVVECLTRDREAAGSSLTGITALWSLSKTHFS